MASADLLLHPVRLRIVQAFLGDRALTTSELRSELPDVPPASRYRHVARLVEAGVLGLDEMAKMSADDHRRAFLAFVAGLIADFDRYLERGDIDLLRDAVSYRLVGLWLNDEELMQLSRQMFAVLQPRLANAPGRGRKR